MNRAIIAVCLGIGCLQIVLGQSVRFDIDMAVANKAGQAAVGIYVSEFSSVQAFQGSLGWNAQNLTLDSIGTFGLETLDESAFFLDNLESGQLSFAWYHPDAVAVDYIQDEPLFTLYFTTNDIAPGESENIWIAQEPTSWLVIQQLNMIYTESDPVGTDGGINVIENLSDLQVEVMNPDCYNDSTGIIEVLPIGGLAGYEYKWSADNASNEIVENIPFGTYTVTVTDALGDTLIRSVELINPDPLVFETFDLDNFYCLDSTRLLSLNAEGGNGDLTYFLDGRAIDDIDGLFLNIGRHLISVADVYGCTKDSTIIVDYDGECGSIVDPIEVLTPNGDGLGDYLDFGDLNDFPFKHLLVMNRWGNTIYESFDYKNDWDGYYNGSLLPSGDYYYILRLSTTETIQSHLTILNEE